TVLGRHGNTLHQVLHLLLEAAVKSYNLSRGLVVGGACIGVLPDYSRKLERNILPVPGFLDDLEEKDVYLVIKTKLVRNPQVLEIRRLIKKSFFDKKDWLVR
ncbi:hypothetical protein, partial [Pseudomonas laurentiana]|uniref:hypothetical protein n=2 Tax=Pseudomonas TaxID=286 RepID=UPI001E305FC4